MAKLSAKFNLKLEADGVKIAESQDTELCLKVLNAIYSIQDSQVATSDKKSNLDSLDDNLDTNANTKTEPIDNFAKKIGVTKEHIIGACDPKNESPYVTLDPQYWEKLKTNTGERGKNAISSGVLALTILNVWMEIINEGKPTQKLARNITSNLNATDKNISRGVKNCEWLQSKPDGTVSINPAKYSKAINLIKLYVTQGETTTE